MGGLTIGPFSFSGGLLTTFAAVLAVIIVGDRLGRARKRDIERKLWIVIGIALLAARAAYVIRFADLYLAAPLSILSIRDGGFSAAPGLIAGAASALFMGWRNRLHLTPLLLSAGAGAAVFALVAFAALVWPQPVSQLPQASLPRLEGSTLALAGLAGKPVVVNLWASWCGPCRREMPVLRQAQLDHPDIAFVFVNQGEPAATIRNYLAEQKITLDNVVLDPSSSMAATLKSKGLPTTFFFDRKGVMVSRRMGEVSAATLSEQLAVLHGPHPKPK